MEESKLKEEQEKEDKAKEASKSEAVSRSDGTGTSQKSKSSKSSAEQDLDIFLLGDLGDDDDGAGISSLGIYSYSISFYVVEGFYFFQKKLIFWKNKRISSFYTYPSF